MRQTMKKTARDCDVATNSEKDDRKTEVRRETVTVLKAKESTNPPQ